MSNGWNDLPIPFGREGLDLKRAVDSVSPSKLTRMQNLRQIEDGSLTPRPGQTVLVTGPGGSTVHSICSAALPALSQHTRVWGINTGVYRGTSGVLGPAADTGYSGDPLSLVPYRTKLRGDPWVFIADRSRMRKMRVDDGVVMPIGLAAPVAACTVAGGVQLFLPIEEFDTGFGVTGFAGTTGGAPTLTYPAGKSTNALQLATVVGGATSGYWSGASKAFAAPIDASTFGSVEVTDDDFVHLWLKLDRPDRITEIRVYLVCSDPFVAVTVTNVPGSHETENTDAFMKAFRSSDFTTLVEQETSSPEALRAQERLASMERAAQRERDARDTSRTGNKPVDQRDASRDPARVTSADTIPGRGQWTEYGVIGVPLRRGDFLRIGSNETKGWATLTGIVVVVQTNDAQTVAVSFDDMYMTGGYGLDSSEPGSEPYDYRTTNFDPRTGAESNPSPEMVAANKLDSIRRPIIVTPAAYGDAAMRQRSYRRGGTSNDNWYFVGVNASDGGLYIDPASDINAEGGGVLEIDHDLPITTVNAAGTTINGQAVPALWGPVQDMLFACGDPYQPGSVYFCVPGAPDYWPVTNRTGVCSDSEELMNGCVWGGQSWVFSREALYQLVPRLSGESNVTALPTGCKKGLVSKWALCAGLGGIYFVTTDSICVTTGDSPTDLTDADVRGLFHGETRNGYLPVDMAQVAKMRLVVHQSELRFLYQDTGGTPRELVLNLLTRTWRWHTYGQACVGLFSETSVRGSTLIMGGSGTGAAYSHTGTSDDGAAITCLARTGALDAGQTRAEKLFGDFALDLDRDGTTVSVQCGLDNETIALAAETVSTGSGRDRYHLHPFGTTPVKGRNVSVEITWSSATQSPKLYFGSISASLLPDTTVKRVTQWDNMGSPAEKFLTGITLIDVNTFGLAKTILVEYTLDNGAVQVASTLTVLANGLKQMRFSWPMVKADLVRLRPTDDNEWNLVDANWDASPEPRRMSKWNGNYVIEGTLADKWVKGIIFECNTFNLPKTIEIYGDGVLQGTETVAANGRQVVQLDWPQFRARVLHYRATDDNPGLPYQAEWVFDEEPWSLTRWETQEITHGITGYHMLLFGSIAYRSSAAVMLTLYAYAQDGTITTKTYTLPSTAGAKQIPYAPFEAVKGIAFKYLFTSSVAFWLYQEESYVMVQPCAGGATLIRHPFGNDNRDKVRNMALAHGGV